jgi:SPP1 gp7 family putative phage head morphogenesis protein
MTRADRMALLMDADRRRVELDGLRAAMRIGMLARVHAISAYRTGANPMWAVRDVVMGNARLGLDGLTPLLQAGMATAHLRGQWRTDVNAAPLFRSRAKQKLAGTAYDDALDWLGKRMELTEAELDALVEKYGAPALRVTGSVTRSMEKRLEQALVDVTREGGGVREGIKALRQAFVTEGWVPGADYTLAGVFRTQTQIAYSAGRWNSLQEPMVQEELWGFEYSAILDDRTTETCRKLDGMRRPKDDETWRRLWPPNHYNCRSTAVEVFSDQRQAQATPVPEGIEAQKGFGVNFGHVFGAAA